MVLLQTILELRRQDVKISWFGEEREVPLPAAVAVNSPWLDITHSMPSIEANVPWDYLPNLSPEGQKDRPVCAAWPASPPRKAFYADDTLVVHPLVSPVTAPSWKGAPPVYICTGWELLADEDRYMARKLHADGVTVVFEEYEAMPHCFALLFTHLDAAWRCVGVWADFMREAVDDPAAVRSRFTTIHAKTLKESAVDPDKLSPFTAEQLQEIVFKGAEIEPWAG